MAIFKDYSLYLFKDLRSSDPSARHQLHQRLAQELQKFPSQNEIYSSLSHCPLASGFVLAQDARVGLDLEDIRRLRPAVIERISTAKERRTAPLLPALWVAKESAFKALSRPLNLQVISELHICEWQVAREEIYFSVHIAQSPVRAGRGQIRVDGDLILGIYYEKA